MTDLDVKSVIQEFGEAFEEFKKVNDERLESLDKGESVSALEEKTDKIEESLSGLEDINQQMTQAKMAQDGMNEKLDRCREKSSYCQQ